MTQRNRHNNIKVEVMRTKCLHALNHQTVEISYSISQIRRHMADIKKLLDSNYMYKVCSYKSKNAELRRLHPKVIVTIPTFSQQKINTEQFHKLFGALSECPSKDSQVYSTAVFFLNKTLDTVHKPLYPMNSSVDEIWTHGQKNITTFYNVYGETLFQSLLILGLDHGTSH